VNSRYPSPSTWNIPALLQAGSIATILVSISFILQSNIDINLVDEGFLWYGTIRTALGDVPLRDFQSYDPGRYFWGALWFKVIGSSSILTLRLSTSIFQILGLTFGLLSLQRITHSWRLLIILGMTLLLWMFPRHKLFEHTIVMVAVYMAVLLLEQPSLLRHFFCGILVGLAGFLGRNHGLYLFLSFSLLITFIWIKLDRSPLLKRFAVWVGGILIGYMPMFLMLVYVPGFSQSFLDSITFLFRIGRTNLPLPVPWFWNIDYSKLTPIQDLNAFSIGLFFLALPIFNLCSFAYLIVSNRSTLKRNPLFIASTCISLTYIHYAFSRADIAHLAQAIHPMLLGLCATPKNFLRLSKEGLKVFFLTLFLGSAFAIGVLHPFCVKALSSEPYLKYKISGEEIWLQSKVASTLSAATKISDRYVKQEGFLVAPHIPSLYPILQRKSPLWEIFFLFPETNLRQNEMIQELQREKVNWILLSDVALDDRDDLRFRNTHPTLWKYFHQNFNVLDVDDVPETYTLMQRK
jgi:hypothetical protein